MTFTDRVLIRLRNDDMFKGGVGLIGIGFLVILIDQLMSKLIWWVGLFPMSVGLFFIVIDIFAVDSQTESQDGPREDKI